MTTIDSTKTRPAPSSAALSWSKGLPKPLTPRRLHGRRPRNGGEGSCNNSLPSDKPRAKGHPAPRKSEAAARTKRQPGSCRPAQPPAPPAPAPEPVMLPACCATYQSAGVSTVRWAAAQRTRSSIAGSGGVCAGKPATIAAHFAPYVPLVILGSAMMRQSITQ